MEPSAPATTLNLDYSENKENLQDSELPSTSAPGPSSWSHYVHYYSNSDTKTTSNQPSNHSYNNYDPSKFQAYHQHQRQLLHARNLFRNEPDEPGYQPVVNYGVPPPPKPPAPNTRDDLSPLCSPCGSPPRMYDFDDEPEDELPPSPPKVQETTENVELTAGKKDKLSPPPMPPDFPFTFPDLRPPPIPPLFPFSTPHLLPLPPLVNIDNGNQNQIKLEPYLRKRLQRELDQLLKAKSTTKLEPWMLFVIDPDLPQPLVDMCKPFLCKLCGLGLSSRIVSIDHYKGKRHRLKINEWLRINRHPLARLFEESNPQSYRPPVPQTQTKPHPLFQIKVPSPNKSAVRNSTNKKKFNKSRIKSQSKKKIANLRKKVVKPIKQSASTSKSTPALSAADVKKNLEYKNALLRQLLNSKIPLPTALRIQCGTWHCKLCDVRHFSLSHSADHYLSYRHRLSALRWLEQNSCVPALLENNARYEPENAPPQQQQPPYHRQYQQQRIPATKPRTYWNYIKKKKIGFFGHHHQSISNSNNNFRTLGENGRRAPQTLNPRPIQQSDLNSSNSNSSELNHRRLAPQFLHPRSIQRREFNSSNNLISPDQNRRLAPQTLYPYFVQQRPFNSNNSGSPDQHNLLILTPVNLISHPLHMQELQQRSPSPGYSGRYEELPPQNVIARTHTPPPQQRNFISNLSSSHPNFHPNLDSENSISHPVVKIARNRPELEAQFPIFRDPNNPGPR